MRVSSLEIFNIATRSMAKANESINTTQQQISSGKAVINPSDDPVASVQIMQLDSQLSRISQYGKDIDVAENTLMNSEGILNGVVDVIQRVRELAVQGANTAVNTSSEYIAMATELEGRLDHLISLVNSRDSAGNYIFSGFKGSTPPVTGDLSQGYAYQGDDGQMRIKTSDSSSVAVSDSGKKLFFDIPSATNTINTYVTKGSDLQVSVGQVIDQDVYDEFYPEDMVVVFNSPFDVNPPQPNFTIKERSTGNLITENQVYKPGEPLEFNGVRFNIIGTPSEGDVVQVESSNKQDIMSTIAKMITAMKEVKDDSASKKELGAIIANTLNNLDNAQTSVLKGVSALGARQSTIMSTRELHTETEFQVKNVLSNLRDLDYAEASTRLNMQSLILQATQSSFVRISNLSLFNKL